MEKSNGLLIIIRHAPYRSSLLREGLDVALVAAAFGQPVDLLFLGHGIIALLDEQGSPAPGLKATRPTMDMLEMYDIEQLWTTEESLEALSLSRVDLRDNVQFVQSQAMPAFMKNYSQILNF